MSRLIAPPKQARLAAFLLAVAFPLAMALLAPSAVIGEGIPLGLSEEYSSDCKPGNDDNIDPVTVLFRGTQASAKKVAFEVKRVAEWEEEGQGDQRLKVKMPGGRFGCQHVDFQPASEPEFTFNPLKVPFTPADLINGDPLDFLDVPDERFHVRLWFVDSSLNATERKTVGTPHFEYFKKWNRGESTCKGIKWEVLGKTVFAKGSHAVKKGGKGTGEDSGFDEGRQELRRSFENTRHEVEPAEQWGNDEFIKQCDGNFAGSNGNGITIQMDWAHGGFTERPAARPSSALLRGRLETTEKSTEWWFEHGPSSSKGAGTYPKKTSVKSVAEATEVDVSQAIAGLSPSSTYYVRMFVRDKEGNVEEGNEVKFETCGWERADEDDSSRGPGAATPECGGAVDSFYRDVNGDLGHQSWSPEGAWSTETRPASIARSAVPRVLHRADGSGVVDVFFREADGDLGHHWWTPGIGWEAEARSASMASDPNVIARPNDTIDVFYRTASGELGHQWWVPGSGWSSETRNATVSSDPHAIAHEDGSIDVFYRSGSSLGRDLRSAGGVWSRETRSGSLVAEPRPLMGKSGAVDVFYRTSENKLGHDWFVPGTGWSRETRSAALVSEPHVVKRPNGTIDVFYRTPGDELGHDWWVSGSGWSTETRPADLSSDPHVVARSDGSLEVFYRDGNRLGHQWLVPGTGWAVESRPGPIAWHTDPHVVTQSDGRIDVIYETPTEQLGRDWYRPGVGWVHEIRPMRRPSRPVAAYSFDEGAGEVAEDLFGNHDGTLENTEWVKGKYGSAIYLDGNDDYVEIPDSPELALNEEFTLETWVRPDEDATWESVIWKETEDFYSYTLMAGGEEAGVPEGALAEEEGVWEDVEGEEDLPDPAWSHLALTYDGANLRLYVDGELIDTEAASPNNEDPEGKLFFGTNDDEDFFNGRIDDVRIYDRALDTGEIAADKVTPVQTQPTQPVAAYSFDGGEGEEGEGEVEGEGETEMASDLFGDHDGEIEGAVWTAAGRYGGALRFDGENDCVTIADATDLELSEELTVEAWVKPRTDSDLPIIYKDSGGNAAYALGIGLYSTGNPEGLIGEGVEEVETVVGPENVQEDVWTHLAFTYDGGYMRIYVNGVLAETEPQSTGPPTGEGALSIGCNHLYPENFEGLIDEVRLYDRALDAGEIAADKATPLQTPQTDPVAAYSFDAGEGEVAEDLFGNHDGTLENTEWVKGKYGSAIYLDGNDDYVEIPDSPELALNEEFTLETWVRPDEDATWESVIWKETEDFYSYTLMAGGEEAGVPEGALAEEEGVWEDVEGEEDLTENAWSHLALTFDGANLRLYVDGELIDTEPATPNNENSAGKLFFGTNGDEDFFNGRIDEVRLYDRALSEAEIDTDKATPLETPPTQPVAAYSFDDGEGEVAVDRARGHDGDLVHTEWVKGKYGSAIYLDGNDDYVEIPDSPELQLEEEFTVSAWVRPNEDDTWEPVIWKETDDYYSYTLMAGGEESGVPEGALAEEEGVWTDVEGNDDLPDPAWSHLALTFDGANLRLYVDGELIDTEPAAPNNEDPEGFLFFGTNDDEHFFDGRIDEVRLYDRALDAGEINADKTTPIQTPPTPPVAAYTFDEGEGEVAKDRARGHDGDLVHTEWVKGKYGSAIYLDGNDDYVEIPDSPELQLEEEFTLSAWVRPDGTEKEAVVISKEAGNFYSYQLFAGSREEAGVPEGFLAYEPWAWEDVEDEENPLQANIWNHLAFTYDGGYLRLYVNGELVDTEWGPPAQASEGPLMIGGNDDEEFFKGRIDEVRVYDRAQSAAELIAGAEQAFAKLDALPVATTESATDVAAKEATLRASVDPGGFGTTYRFEYGKTTSYGTKVPIPDGSVGSGTEAVPVSQTIKNLEAGTTYHYRVVATSSNGTTNGNDLSFATAAPPVYESSFGSSGTGSGQFAHPAGIAQLPSGNLWIADAGNDRLQKFNEAGEYKFKFGSTGTGNGKFDRPTDVAIDSKENLWVTDAENSRVQKFDSNGEYLSQFGSVGTGNGQFGNDGPEALAIDSKGNVWVADTYNGRLQKFNDKGEFVKVISSKGSGTGQLGQPTGIDIGPNGDVWVADWQYNRVVAFNEAGEYIRQFGTEGTGNGQFKHPSAIEVDSKGNVWVTDQDNSRVQQFTEAGSYVAKFGTAGSGSGQFSFSNPTGIFADTKGNLWVSDTGNNRVQRWGESAPPTATTQEATSLTSSAAVLKGAVNPNAKATTYRFEYGKTTSYGTKVPIPDGSVGSGTEAVPVSQTIKNLEAGTTYHYRVVATSSNGTTNGNDLSFATAAPPVYESSFGSSGTGSGQFAHPAGIAQLPSGNLWIADAGNDRLQKFNEAGEYKFKFGSTGTGNGKFDRPTDVAIDSKENLWVTDAENSRVQKFDSNGEYLSQFGSVGTGNGQFGNDGPEALAIDSKGNVWVADTYNGRLQKFNDKGEFVKVISSKGSGTGQLGQPTGIDIGPNGDVWVADWQYNRVVAFNEAGEYIRQFGTEGTGNGQFKHPSAIEVDSKGNVWVTDQDNSRVQQFTEAGSYVAKFGTAGSGSGQFSFSNPTGIFADTKGNLWVSDTGNNRVQRWGP